MKKIVFFLSLLILIQSCGFTPVYVSNKNVNFEEINLGEQPDRMNEMLQKSGGRRTVPQIFIGETHVGGSDELHALEKAGKLNSLLNI